MQQQKAGSGLGRIDAKMNAPCRIFISLCMFVYYPGENVDGSEEFPISPMNSFTSTDHDGEVPRNNNPVQETSESKDLKLEVASNVSHVRRSNKITTEPCSSPERGPVDKASTQSEQELSLSSSADVSDIICDDNTEVKFDESSVSDSDGNHSVMHQVITKDCTAAAASNTTAQSLKPEEKTDSLYPLRHHLVNVTGGKNSDCSEDI